MPEGHTVHRTARSFEEGFVGRRLSVASPQGRFAREAALVSETELVRSYAIGKHLFLDFENERTIHIHLGIYGKWRFYDLKAQEPPEPRGELRATFQSDLWFAELRGPNACELLEPHDFARLVSRLGPDPITSVDDPAELVRFVRRVVASRSAIGQLLMDQSVISGIGNVYRAELLFRAGISPYAAGNSLSQEQLASLWKDAGQLMRLGVKTGIMLTRDGYLNHRVALNERYNVYKRQAMPCRNCGELISLALMQGRKLYWCASCQA